MKVKLTNAQRAKDLFDRGECPICGKTHYVAPATKHDDAVMDACERLLWLPDIERILATK
jgi:hypothetical protein